VTFRWSTSVQTFQKRRAIKDGDIEFRSRRKFPPAAHSIEVIGGCHSTAYSVGEVTALIEKAATAAK
jgi:hypothetical protein